MKTAIGVVLFIFGAYLLLTGLFHAIGPALRIVVGAGLIYMAYVGSGVKEKWTSDASG